MDWYPIPQQRPAYVEQPTKQNGRGGVPVYQAVAAVFVVVALGFALWLAGLLLLSGITGVYLVVNALLFWLVLTYLALPRLHQIFTFLYVPDYFIGRTRTGDGLLGDPVNLALDGSADDLHAAMLRAGWTRADPITWRTSIGIVRSALLRRPYPSAPVSDLMLFGRRQEFAYQQEVDGNASRRHHVRFWRVPDGWLLPGGHRTDWLAGATYDRAVGLSLFTLQVTHKIDANIDVERDYVINTIRYADHDCGVSVLADFSTAYHARNGGGDRIQTDGNLPVLDLSGAAARDGVPAPAARPDAAPSARDLELPPKSLLFAGALLAVLVVAAAVELARGVPDSTLGIGVSLALCLTWGLTVARHRWAWLALMSIASAFTLGALVLVTSDATAGEEGLLLSALAVLVVLAVSDEAVRGWVAKGRPEPTIGPATGAFNPHDKPDD